MYPDFQYVLEAITGHEMPAWLGIFKTFGFLVALSFICAAWAISKELLRKEKQGLLKPIMVTVTTGQRVTAVELISSAVVGFLLGFKVGGLFLFFSDISRNPMGYLFSSRGYLLTGVIGAVVIAAIKYFERKKQELPEPVTKTVPLYPHQRITEIVVVAAVGGLAGSKIFNVLETWDESTKSLSALFESLTSSNGLTFLGGLIMATLAFYWYARKNKIPFKHLCDAAAPGIMLAYGLGRLGCHFAGDGDWGIFNTAYVTGPDNTLHAATTAADNQFAMQMIGHAPHAFAAAPSWLPRWLFGMNYPHNVAEEGMRMHDCVREHYCNVLPVSTFPTSVYEAIACVGLFFFLWAIRKKFTRSLQMFGTYLILVGLERFLVELVRVNYKYDWGFIHPTQAEILSVTLAITGTCLLLFYKDKPAAPPDDKLPEKV